LSQGMTYHQAAAMNTNRLMNCAAACAGVR
jgi:hypothetical protein